MEYHTTFLSLPEGRRIIAVSDIHGHLSLLKALLEKIRYKPGDDLLFLVGDTVEKGPDSLGTLRYVMRGPFIRRWGTSTRSPSRCWTPTGTAKPSSAM